ncbi:MAG: 23S rRNA (pseudouridine(1915)-N(3))-methyltransferase RlmH [bacterium]
MKVSIICVGKIKEKYFCQAIEEYTKRLSKYVKLNIIEVSDEKAPENLSRADEEIVKHKEGERILKNINNLNNEMVIGLCIDGKNLDSIGFAEFIQDKKNRGISHVYFIIGGSLGLSERVLKRLDFKLSFSSMTFPHQLMRVILLEQIYRVERILKNEPYHK